MYILMFIATTAFKIFIFSSHHELKQFYFKIKQSDFPTQTFLFISIIITIMEYLTFHN